MDYAGGGKGCGKTIFAQIVQAIEIVEKNLQHERKTAWNGVNLSTPGGRFSSLVTAEAPPPGGL